MSRVTTTAYALLGLIAARATSTYELARWMRWSNLRALWPRTESQVYKAPKVLASAGLAEARTEFKGERKRTIYEATEQGREALRRWLDAPSDHFRYRYEAAVKVTFANHGSIESLRRTLRAAVIEAEEDARQILDVARQRTAAPSPAPEREHLNAVADGLILEVVEARLRWARSAERRVAEWESTTVSDALRGEAEAMWREYEQRLSALLDDASDSPPGTSASPESIRTRP